MKQLLIFCFFFTVAFAKAQDRPTQKQRADRLFERYEYAKSAEIYSAILYNGNDDLEVVEKLAACYRKMNNYKLAESYYAKAVSSTNASTASMYYYAEMLLANQKFEPARRYYREYFAKVKNEKLLALRTANCDSAELWTQAKTSKEISNEQKLNSTSSDWGVTFLQDSVLSFLSDRNVSGKTKNYQWTGNSWLRPLFLNGRGQVVPLPLFPELAENDLHVGPVLISRDGNTAYITVTTQAEKENIRIDQKDPRLYTRRLELLIAKRENGKWGGFEPFKYNNINSYSVGHAALSADEHTLYFVSDRPGGLGKTDIWFCKKLEDGSWAEPVNCGEQINTDGEEAFVTIGGNGKLYFSSNGLPGMGGFDIFSSSGKESDWTKPVNLRYPVNSTTDDFWLSTNNGVSGYFSSNRPGGRGNDDIYSFGPAKKVTEPPKKEIMLSGKPLITGKSIVLKDIYYDLDKFDIRSDAAKVLDSLVLVMKENPELKIELSSHTDSRGSDEYNLHLSQQRAEAAVSYLVANGISKERLFAKGYGETKLLNRCKNDVTCSEEEHQLNRRTEVKRLQ